MLVAMDEWHRKLVNDLTQETAAGFVPDAAAALEIAFGQARSAITYTLELARAHRIPVAGNVSGDAIWLHLGEQRLRLTLNRRAGEVVVQRPEQDSVTVKVGGEDLGAMARSAIDAMVAAFKALPAEAKRPSMPPSDFEEETTKA
jgi:hypothetical protein